MQTARAELPCRLIVDPPASGPWNMAVDEALLADAANHSVATLRLYQWNEPTLSLGYFQACEDRRQHAASDNAAVVRRQSGGGAILHDRELTYSLSLPAEHPFAHQAALLYIAVHEAFIEALAPLIAAVQPGWKLTLRGEDSPLSAREEPFLCFLRRARGDLLLVAAAEGPSAQVGSLVRRSDGPEPNHKILGSAQRRRRGAILQHGSLLLEKSAAAPELAGLCDLTGASLTAAQLAAVLPVRLGTRLGVRFKKSRIPDELRPSIMEFETRKYAAAAWTNRR